MSYGKQGSSVSRELGLSLLNPGFELKTCHAAEASMNFPRSSQFQQLKNQSGKQDGLVLA